MIRSSWCTLAVSLALILLCRIPPAWGQPTIEADTSDTTNLMPKTLEPLDTTSQTAPLAPQAVGEVLPTAFPSEPGAELRSLPPIPPRKYGVRSPALPLVVPGDTIIVPQITGRITDPELKARADSLNRRVRTLAIEERLLLSEVTGENPHVGLLSRRDYLEARADLLRTMETSLQNELKEKLATLDVTINELDSTVQANRDREIATLEGFIARFPESRQIADAKFILGQLYYDRERQRFAEASKRWSAEIQRYNLNLIPVMPKQPTQNEQISVPFYRDVVQLGTNRDLIPYSLYSLGKYHYEQARDLTQQVSDARRFGTREEVARLDSLRAAQADSAKAYFARLIVEFPDDTVNVPDAYSVLASHYFVLGRPADRDTAAVYCQAIVRDYWYSPRYQSALVTLGQIAFWNGIGTVTDRELRNRYYSEALAYMAWLARDVDAFTDEQIPGVSPDRPAMMDPSRRDYAVTFMTQIITRPAPPLPGLEPPPPVETAVKLVTATGNPPFGADLLRRVGDKKNDDYATTQDPQDLVAALTAYDTLLSRYPTYKDGPKIQQMLIDRSYFLAATPQEQYTIYYKQKLAYFERFNHNSEWARRSDAPPEVIQAADDSAATYLEAGAKHLYVTAQAAGDREGIRKALDYFVKYFQTYPDRPQAYELNWTLAGELDDLGDYDRAYEEYMRVSNSLLGTYREQAAINAVAAAQRLLDMEQQSAPPPEPEGR